MQYRLKWREVCNCLRNWVWMEQIELPNIRGTEWELWGAEEKLSKLPSSQGSNGSMDPNTLEKLGTLSG